MTQTINFPSYVPCETESKCENCGSIPALVSINSEGQCSFCKRQLMLEPIKTTSKCDNCENLYVGKTIQINIKGECVCCGKFVTFFPGVSYFLI